MVLSKPSYGISLARSGARMCTIFPVLPYLSASVIRASVSRSSRWSSSDSDSAAASAAT